MADPTKTEKKSKNHKQQVKQWNALVSTFFGTAVKISFYAVALALIISGSRFAYRFSYRLFAKEASALTGTSYQVEITEETDVLYLGKQLAASGVIEDAYVFYAQYLFFEYKLQPGKYLIYTDMSSRGVLDCLASGTSERGDTENE